MADPAAMAALPAGTVAFLSTDLEGSTRLLEAHPAAYRDAVRRHHALLQGAVEAHGGVVFETVGDAVYAAFASPSYRVGASRSGGASSLVCWSDLRLLGPRPTMAPAAAPVQPRPDGEVEPSRSAAPDGGAGDRDAVEDVHVLRGRPQGPVGVAAPPLEHLGRDARAARAPRAPAPP